LSLKLKLALAFGSILFLLVIVAGASFYGMQQAMTYQASLYTASHTLEGDFKTLAKLQNDFLYTGDSVTTRDFFNHIKVIRSDLSKLMIRALENKPIHTQYGLFLNALDAYEKKFAGHVEMNVARYTIESRLFHESRRLMANIDAIEKMGESAIGFLKIMNETLEAEKKYMFGHVKSSVSMVLHNTNRMISMAEQIQQESSSNSVKLYAFRIGKLADVYKSVFHEYVQLSDLQQASAQNVHGLFEQLEGQLNKYLDLMVLRGKQHIAFLKQLIWGIVLLAILLGVCAMVILARRITQPINDLNQSARQILGGNFNSQVKVTSKDEIAQLGHSFNQMARKLEKSFQDLSIYQEGLERQVKERTREIRAEIERHKATQNALEKEKDRALTYFEVAGSILVVLNPDATVAMINKSGRRLLDYTSGEIIGKNWFDTCIPREARKEVALVFKKIMNDQLAAVEFFENQVITRHGEIRIISWHNTLLKDDSGSIIASLSSGEDITDVERLEKQQQQLEAQLVQARKMEAIGTLAGGIAHDFNNILYPVIGFTEMAMTNLDSDHPAHTNLSNVLKGALRAKELVRQILTFSRKKSLEIKPLAVQPIIKEALKLLRSTIPKNITILHDIDDSTAAVVADPTQIYEIIMNLCTNAYHAMETTGGVLTVIFEEKTIARDDAFPLEIEPGLYCVLTVKDTGPGISEEIIKQVFEPYFTTKETGKGSGLGLSVVHGIVKAYNGGIEVKSQKGKGAGFHVYLPCIQEDIFGQETEKPVEKQSGSETILFVDDEKEIVSLGVQALSALGYTVEGQTDSKKALEIFKKQPDRFDVLVTDMTMPGMLGTQLAEKVLEKRPDLPVIICTGFSELVDEKKAKAMGIKAYLKKPILMNELSGVIQSIINAD
jgi:PAS domain S-box-containing protein